MKITRKDTLIRYMVYFPMINILFFTLMQGKYTNVLYIFSEVLIIVLAIKQYGIFKKDSFMLFLLFLYIPFSYLIHNYFGEIPIIINFIYFVSMAFVLNNNNFKSELISYILKNSRKISIVSIIYIGLILLTVVYGTGLKEGWETTTLKGPYGTPHTLAYELLTLICLNLFIIIKHKKILNIIISFSLLVMILFTASRSVLVGLFIILIFFVSRFGVNKKIMIFIGAMTIGAYLIVSTTILDPIIKKTNLAISNGSISNGRLWIFESSIKTFWDYPGFFKWIVGIGYNNLLMGNFESLNYSIQAHNDILNALIAFGLIFAIIFIYSIFRMVRGENGYFYKLLLLMALINLNGMVSYMPLAIPIIVVISFLETEKMDVKKQLKI